MNKQVEPASTDSQRLLQQIAEAAEAVKRLADHFDGQAPRDRRGFDGARGFDEEQLDIELEFRALRNGLGNFGRRGNSDIVLMRSPRHKGDRLVFADRSLPGATDRIVVRYPGGERTTFRPDQLEHGQELEVGTEAVSAVQLLDRHGTVIRLGIPYRDH
ncbi:hypothetical protein ACIA8O_02865 [Kitasatospora sp. NPDC051853]|uniref:hypothetical protein n=1 Tax=Kitasatospora sp. NPDC051853 TaxID=3364058 RepID=UPI00379F32CE